MTPKDSPKRVRGAPKAVALETYRLLSESDVTTIMKDLSSLCTFLRTPRARDIEALNETLSFFLKDLEPGTYGKKAREARFKWYAETERAASNLRRLLEPRKDAALLASGVGEPMLMVFHNSRPRQHASLEDWETLLSDLDEALDHLERAAGNGRETLEVELFGREYFPDGSTRLRTSRRPGRPRNRDWLGTVERLLAFWHLLTDKEASVTTDPYSESKSRRSIGATFVAALLNRAADNLPGEKLWAAPHLKNQEARIIEFLVSQRPSQRYRRRKRKSTR